MDIHTTDRILVVAPAGELDIATAPLLLETLTEVLTDKSARTLVFDLRDVTFMDSSAAKCLIYAKHRMGLRDGQVIVRHARPPVVRLIRLLGLDEMVELEGWVPDVAPPSHGRGRAAEACISAG